MSSNTKNLLPVISVLIILFVAHFFTTIYYVNEKQAKIERLEMYITTECR